MPGVLYIIDQMVLSKLVQKVGVYRCYVAHIISFHCVWLMSGFTRLLIRMHEKIPKKLHAQVFLRMNTWLVKTCRRQLNQIINENSVHFVGYYICVSQCTVQKM